MIDFRFHLISLVAVFLALGLGILMGSVVLDQQLVAVLKRDVEELREDKQQLQDDVIGLERQQEANTRFADVAEDWLITDALADRAVLVMQLEGTDDRVVDGVRTAIETAGGRVAGTITFTEQMALPDVVERDQLALAVESTSGEAAELRADAGDFIGSRVAAAATSGTREGRVDAADNAAVNLLLELEESGFVELDGIEEGRGIEDAELLLVGGSPEDRPFNLTGFVTAMARAVASRGTAFVVGESSESRWGLVEAVRSDDVADDVATIDHAETIAGRIAAALALQDAAAGITEHYGTGPGASEVIPRPTPED